MPRRERRIPHSRKEMRESHTSHSMPTPLPNGGVQLLPASACLYAPYECSTYRYAPQWCSSCQVRAASLCAQNGWPDVRPLFHYQTAPVVYGACHLDPVRQVAMCPTSMAVCPSAPLPVNIPCGYPPVCENPSSGTKCRIARIEACSNVPQCYAPVPARPACVQNTNLK